MAARPFIDAPGVYDIDHETYHADPVIVPSLSAGIAHKLVGRSAKHAQLCHPRLNPDFKEESSDAMDYGSAAHVAMLEPDRARERVCVILADNFTTKAAKEAREDARNAGRIPVLARRWAEIQKMVEAGRAQLLRHEDSRGAFENGKPEQTLVWREGDVWCRCRLDWMPHGGNVFFDYKTTGASAHPDEWGKRSMFDQGNDVRAAFYARGIRAVLGIERPVYKFVVQETEPPYALCVMDLGPTALEVADQKVQEAIDWWAWCLKRNRWPGYPRITATVGLPAWKHSEWEDRRARESLMAESGVDKFALALDFFRPLEPSEAAE